MFYVVNNHLNNLYVLPNKAVGTGKNQKLLNIEPTSIPEARVGFKNVNFENHDILFYLFFDLNHQRTSQD